MKLGQLVRKMADEEYTSLDKPTKEDRAAHSLAYEFATELDRLTKMIEDLHTKMTEVHRLAHKQNTGR